MFGKKHTLVCLHCGLKQNAKRTRCRRCQKAVLRGIGERFLLQDTLALTVDMVTYKGWDKADCRPVVIRLLRKDAAAVPKQQFNTEARLLAGFGAGVPLPALLKCGVHPSSGLAFAVYEFLEGQPLGEVARGVSQSRRVELVRLAMGVIGPLHQNGWVHSCLSPRKLLVGKEGQVTLFDFRGARQAGSSSHGLGISGYKAPEQYRGMSPVSPATDVFALGAILYELLTGRLPYRCHGQDMLREAGYFPPSPSTLNHHVLPELDGVILQALERNPDERFADAVKFSAALWRVIGCTTHVDSLGVREDCWRNRINSGCCALGRAAVASLRLVWRHPIATGTALMLAGSVCSSFFWLHTGHREPAMVQFLSWPPSDVYIDEVLVCQAPSPSSQQLHAGKHRVVLRGPENQAINLDLDLFAGESVVVTADLARGSFETRKRN